jgi:hypothetical protein
MNAVSEQQAPTVTRAPYAPIERKKKCFELTNPRVPDVAAAEPHADASRRGHAAGNGEDVVTIGTEILPCFSFSNLFWFLTDTAAEM